jgi:hypothetical protein
MTSTDVEQQRQRYANELAEYTRRQWDMARRSLERSRSPPDEKAQPNGQLSPSKDNSRASQGQRFREIVWVEGMWDDQHVAGIQSHDYAHRSHRRGGNIAHEGRAVAANWYVLSRVYFCDMRF